jgi:lysozyme
MEKDIDTNEMIQRFVLNEGCSLMPYKDTKGYETIGIGRCIDKNPLTQEEKKVCGDYKHGITKNAAFYLLRNDIERAKRDCNKAIPFFDALDKERRYCLIDMCFQMGKDGLLGFKKMLRAMGVGNWEEAYKECLDSDYAREDSPKRAKRIARTIKTGRFEV